MRSRFLTLALVTVALASTTGTLWAFGSTKITLTIHSSPEGAMMTENGKLWGATPFALAYKVSGRFRTCLNTPPISVRWASGAEALLPSVALCPATGKNQVVTLQRPADVEGLAIDLQVAYQQAMLAQMQALTAAANEPAPPVYQPAAAPRTKRCITIPVIGGNGATYTTCS